MNPTDPTNPIVWSKTRNPAAEVADNIELIRIQARKLGDTFNSVALVITEWGKQFYHVAEYSYREKHGRLPGSLRTKRLRKKRFSVIVKDFMKS